MSGVISTGNFAKLLWPGLNSTWGLTEAQYPQQWSRIYTTKQSSKNYEEDVALVGLGLAPVKPEGTAVQYDSMQQSFSTRYVHVDYGLGFIVTRNEYEDNLYIKYGTQRTQSLSKSMNQTKENIGADTLNLGFTTFLTGDGAVLFSASHPTASGNQSNILTVSADLSEASLEQMIINIKNARDERNLRINIMSQALIISPSEEFNAERILKNADRPGTADRDINALYQTNKFPQGYIVNNYLTDPDAYFVSTDAENGFTHYERRALNFSVDNDFDTDNAKFKADARYSFGVTNWRSMYASPGV